jgi:hypothetical protein
MDGFFKRPSLITEDVDNEWVGINTTTPIATLDVRQGEVLGSNLYSLNNVTANDTVLAKNLHADCNVTCQDIIAQNNVQGSNLNATAQLMINGAALYNPCPDDPEWGTWRSLLPGNLDDEGYIHYSWLRRPRNTADTLSAVINGVLTAADILGVDEWIGDYLKNKFFGNGVPEEFLQTLADALMETDENGNPRIRLSWNQLDDNPVAGEEHVGFKGNIYGANDKGLYVIPLGHFDRGSYNNVRFEGNYVNNRVKLLDFGTQTGYLHQIRRDDTQATSPATLTFTASNKIEFSGGNTVFLKPTEVSTFVATNMLRPYTATWPHDITFGAVQSRWRHSGSNGSSAIVLYNDTLEFTTQLPESASPVGFKAPVIQFSSDSNGQFWVRSNITMPDKAIIRSVTVPTTIDDDYIRTSYLELRSNAMVFYTQCNLPGQVATKPVFGANDYGLFVTTRSAVMGANELIQVPNPQDPLGPTINSVAFPRLEFSVNEGLKYGLGISNDLLQAASYDILNVKRNSEVWLRNSSTINMEQAFDSNARLVRGQMTIDSSGIIRHNKTPSLYLRNTDANEFERVFDSNARLTRGAMVIDGTAAIKFYGSNCLMLRNAASNDDLDLVFDSNARLRRGPLSIDHTGTIQFGGSNCLKLRNAASNNALDTVFDSNATLTRGKLTIDHNGVLAVAGTPMITELGSFARRSNMEEVTGFMVSPSGFVTVGETQIWPDGRIFTKKNLVSSCNLQAYSVSACNIFGQSNVTASLIANQATTCNLTAHFVVGTDFHGSNFHGSNVSACNLYAANLVAANATFDEDFTLNTRINVNPTDLGDVLVKDYGGGGGHRYGFGQYVGGIVRVFAACNFSSSVRISTPIDNKQHQLAQFRDHVVVRTGSSYDPDYGYVGIGTPAPLSRLHVNGEITESNLLLREKYASIASVQSLGSNSSLAVASLSNNFHASSNALFPSLQGATNSAAWTSNQLPLYRRNDQQVPWASISGKPDFDEQNNSLSIAGTTLGAAGLVLGGTALLNQNGQLTAALQSVTGALQIRPDGYARFNDMLDVGNDLDPSLRIRLGADGMFSAPSARFGLGSVHITKQDTINIVKSGVSNVVIGSNNSWFNGSVRLNNMLVPSGGTAMYLVNNALQGTQGNSFALWQSSTGETVINSAPNAPLAFKNSNVEYLRLSPNGNFGVRTTNPAAALHVVGDAIVTGGITEGGTWLASKYALSNAVYPIATFGSNLATPIASLGNSWTGGSNVLFPKLTSTSNVAFELASRSNPAFSNVRIEGQGGGGASVGLTMAPWRWRPSGPPVVLSASDDGNFSASFVVRTASPGNMGSNVPQDRFKVRSDGVVEAVGNIVENGSLLSAKYAPVSSLDTLSNSWYSSSNTLWANTQSNLGDLSAKVIASSNAAFEWKTGELLSFNDVISPVLTRYGSVWVTGNAQIENLLVVKGTLSAATLQGPVGTKLAWSSNTAAWSSNAPKYWTNSNAHATTACNVIANNVFIGNFGHSGAFFGGMSHKDKVGVNDYAFLQGGDGSTYVNASTGKSISLRVNNENVAFVDNTGLIVNDRITLNNSEDGIYLRSGTSNDHYWRIRHSVETDTGTGNIDFFVNKGGGETIAAWIEDEIMVASRLNFTGSHRCMAVEPLDTDTMQGMVVVATGEYDSLLPPSTTPRTKLPKDQVTINEALPSIRLCTKKRDPCVFGVVAGLEERTECGKHVFRTGSLVSCVSAAQDTTERVEINAIGEGAVWVCDGGGDLDCGDLLTTSDLPGYAEKQPSDQVRNYTLGKITCSVNWKDPKLSSRFKTRTVSGRKCAFVGCVYMCG